MPSLLEAHVSSLHRSEVATGTVDCHGTFSLPRLPSHLSHGGKHSLDWGGSRDLSETEETCPWCVGQGGRWEFHMTPQDQEIGSWVTCPAGYGAGKILRT